MDDKEFIAALFNPDSRLGQIVRAMAGHVADRSTQEAEAIVAGGDVFDRPTFIAMAANAVASCLIGIRWYAKQNNVSSPSAFGLAECRSVAAWLIKQAGHPETQGTIEAMTSQVWKVFEALDDLNPDQRQEMSGLITR